MTKKLKLRTMGGSIGATLPKEIAERFNWQAGDTVFAIETDDGVLLSAYDRDFEEAMEVYEEGAKRYRNALRELAK